MARKQALPNTAQNRNRVEPSWPSGGYMITRPIADYNYDVSWPFGNSVSTAPTGSWTRGDVVKQGQPNMHPPTLGYFAYDPTDPTTWTGPRGQ